MHAVPGVGIFPCREFHWRPPIELRPSAPPGGRDPEISTSLRPPFPALEFRKRVRIPSSPELPPCSLRVPAARRDSDILGGSILSASPDVKGISCKCQADSGQAHPGPLWAGDSSARLGSMASVRGGIDLTPPRARRSPQRVNFNPSCITRLLPEPTSGLPAATSGVAHPQPNVLGISHVIGSTRCASIPIRCAVWIRDNGVIEQIEESRFGT